jgi:hypothetical protein
VEDVEEKLQISILGSRRASLMIEGSSGSLDIAIMSRVFPSHTIFPQGSCEEVARSVAALNKNRVFHHYDVIGIIDGDLRAESEIKSLRRKGIYVLQLHEIENILVSDEVITAVLKNMGHNRESYSKIISKISESLKKSSPNGPKNGICIFTKNCLLGI